ncbi:MAG: hypothetical protein AABW48_05735 [Nanoarchaeota archaeon]
MTIKDTSKTLDKIIDTGKTLEKVDPDMVAKALGAQSIGPIHRTRAGIDILRVAERLGARLQPDLPELTREEVEANRYVPLGSPAIVPPNPDPDFITYFNSKTLRQQGLPVDNVVGYVVSRYIPDSVGEAKNVDCSKQLRIIRYYGKKNEI